ncbi:MAG TPA: hypothetical protein VFF04_02135 [Candidatus Babeliales bacterium]|nr:hypothetical protein [Candidatus Babeliales bacterium]
MNINPVKIFLLLTVTVCLQAAYDENEQHLKEVEEQYHLQSCQHTIGKLATEGIEKVPFQDLDRLKSLVDTLPDQTQSKIFKLIDSKIDSFQTSHEDMKDRNHLQVNLKRIKRRRNLSVLTTAVLAFATSKLQQNTPGYIAVGCISGTAISLMYCVWKQDQMYDIQNILELREPEVQETDGKKKSWLPGFLTRKKK